MYPLPKWHSHAAFFDFVGYTVDEHNFNFSDAEDDERVRIRLKAYGEVEDQHYTSRLEYWAMEFDGEYIGLVIGEDEPWGWVTYETYITNYPKFQALVAYVNAMYVNKPENLVGETTQVNDLDGRFGYVIDKRFNNNMRKEDKT